MDTNPQRIACRVLGEGPKQPNWRLRLSLSEVAGPKGANVQWNQALLDLGALICTARAPKYGDCPVRSYAPQAVEDRETILQRGRTACRMRAVAGSPGPVAVQPNGGIVWRGKAANSINQAPAQRSYCCLNCSSTPWNPARTMLSIASRMRPRSTGSLVSSCSRTITCANPYAAAASANWIDAALEP